MTARICSMLVAVAGCVSATAPARAQAPITLKNESGSTVVSIGALVQPQVDWETRPGSDGVGSLSLRRLRLMSGGKLARRLSYFIESDSPNLGVHTRDRFPSPEIFLQDLILTYDIGHGAQVDAGLLMVPVSYNSLQSATSLLAIGYGPYSFASSAPTTSTVGRDYGAQVRGYASHRHVEYRLGVFEGIRQVDRTAAPRLAGRIAWYPYDANTGFFYQGSSLGKKRLVSVGASFDQQASYRSRAVDVYADIPLSRGDAVTVQGDVIYYAGGTQLPTLRRQVDWLAEGGYYWKRAKAGAYAQVARRDMAAASQPDTFNYQVGLAYWLRGHRLNIKAGIGQARTSGAPVRTQLAVQTQFLAF